ncbi:hypothetical protein D7X75_19140 [Corallococcus sp. CA031C]|nr:hypothetical protein D7X75_19140 [Corallococcus sp. CA031C]
MSHGLCRREPPLRQDGHQAQQPHLHRALGLQGAVQEAFALDPEAAPASVARAVEEPSIIPIEATTVIPHFIGNPLRLSVIGAHAQTVVLTILTGGS